MQNQSITTNNGTNNTDDMEQFGSIESEQFSAAAAAEVEMVLPPEHLFSDYVEIGYLGIVISAGLALNVCVLKRLMRERRRAQRGNKSISAFLLLKLNLNISDILILLLHASGKLGWLITYEWRAGALLCRLFNCMSMFTLYLSSNIVICIALDRLLTVLRARMMDLGKRKLNQVRLMLTVAWSLSLLFSLPQLIVWTTYNPFKETMSRGWIQCTDIWSIDRNEQLLRGHSNNTANQPNGTSTDEVGWWYTIILQPMVQNTYEITHLFLVFYGPLIALVFCYALISTRLIRFAENNPSSAIIPQNSADNVHAAKQSPPRIACIASERRLLFKRASVKSFPALRVYYSPMGAVATRPAAAGHGGGCARSKSHQLPMLTMGDIVEVSTRAEEPSSCGTMSGCAEQQHSRSLHNIHRQDGESANDDVDSSRRCTTAGGKGQNLLVLLNGNHQSNSSLPVPLPAAAHHQQPNDDDEFPGRSILQLHMPDRNNTAFRPSSISNNCSNSSSAHDLSRFAQLHHHHKHQQQEEDSKLQQKPLFRQKSRRILFNIRTSIGGKRKNLRRTHRLKAELSNMRCTSASSLFENGCTSQCNNKDRGVEEQHGICLPIAHIWQRCWPKNDQKQQDEPDDVLCAAHQPNSQVPPPPNHFLPASSSASASRRASAWLLFRSASARSSFSSSMLSLPAPPPPLRASSGAASVCAAAPAPLWRRHVRSRAFRATLLVILVHLLLWSPYNVYALMKHVNERWSERMSEQANVLKDLQFLITLINPFLYNFGRIGGGSGATAKRQQRKAERTDR